MTDAKRAVLAELGPRWLLAPGSAALVRERDAALGRPAPVLVDLGGGTGEATRAWAAEHPDHLVLAVELHRPGIVRLLRDLDAEGPGNVRVVEADGTALLDSWDGPLAGLRALFPDPWPKRRHVGRRLVQPPFVARAADLLVDGGRLHLATDWLAYADHMRAALATEPRLVPVIDVVDPPPEPPDPSDPSDRADPPVGPRWRTQRPDRPVTAYEQRGLDAGRAPTDLVAVRRS